MFKGNGIKERFAIEEGLFYGISGRLPENGAFSGLSLRAERLILGGKQVFHLEMT
jgi:hypothetical protein